MSIIEAIIVFALIFILNAVIELISYMIGVPFDLRSNMAYLSGAGTALTCAVILQ